jgi:hypothetical protein
MTGVCSTTGGGVVAFGAAGALAVTFLVFTAEAVVGLAAAFLAGFETFLTAGFAVFVEVAFTLSAADELVFFAGIGPHLWV